MKSGYKSSEFWLTMPGALALIEAAQSFESETVQIVGMAGAAACIMWYTFKRTTLKQGGAA